MPHLHLQLDIALEEIETIAGHPDPAARLAALEQIAQAATAALIHARRLADAHAMAREG